LPLIMPDEEMKRTAPPKPPSPPRAAPPPPPAPPAPPPRAAPPPPQAKARALSDDDGAADTATLSQAEPVLTETMAELYLKQGHQQDALRVYQALLAQRPNDRRLKARVEQLSHGGKKGSGVSAQAFLKGIWSGRGAGGGAAAASPVQQSTLAAAFDVADPTPGEPSRPAQDHISLDSVFGEEAARRSTAPPPSERPPESQGDQTGGFSFDEFFAGGKEGAGASGATTDTAGTKAPAGGRTSGRSQRPPEDEAEADQFQQWLKKLKS
jgi:hypothetical protein